MICFDIDGETTALSENPSWKDRPTVMSQCLYGPQIGVPRFLDVLEAYDVPATFFIPTWIVEEHPDMAIRIHESRHEIGAHGHLHEKLNECTPAEEEEILEKSLAIFARVLEHRPIGHRAPWFETNPGTPELLHRHGFRYSSSLMGDDIPYQHTNGLVEIPLQWHLEDWEQFAFHPADPQWGVMPENPDKVFDLWWSEFEAMHDFGCCFVLTLHPWLSGRPSRVRLLERMLLGMKEKGDVWFATGSEIADFVASGAKEKKSGA